MTPKTAADGDAVEADTGADPWGPHDCPYDEDYEWWRRGEEMFVRGHLVDVTCESCGEGSVGDLIEGHAFVFVCECQYERERVVGEGSYQADHTIEITPWGSIDDWHVFGTGGQEVDVTVEEEFAVAEYDWEGETRRWRIESQTLFDMDVQSEGSA